MPLGEELENLWNYPLTFKTMSLHLKGPGPCPEAGPSVELHHGEQRRPRRLGHGWPGYVKNTISCAEQFSHKCYYLRLTWHQVSAWVIFTIKGFRFLNIGLILVFNLHTYIRVKKSHEFINTYRDISNQPPLSVPYCKSAWHWFFISAIDLGWKITKHSFSDISNQPGRC